MVPRKKQPKEEYELLAIELTNYKASVDAAISYEVRDKRLRHDGTKVYDFVTSLELEGVCLYPEEREGEQFTLSVRGEEHPSWPHSMTLADCHVLDEHGAHKYRKVRGEQVPVYDIPKDIGFLEKVRGEKAWSGAVWVAPQINTDMLALLPNVRPLYLALHELRIGRRRFVSSMTLQTTNPAEE